MVESPLSTTFRGKSCGSGSNENFFDAQEEDPRPDPVLTSRERFELRKVHSDGAIGSTQNPNFVRRCNTGVPTYPLRRSSSGVYQDVNEYLRVFSKFLHVFFIAHTNFQMSF